MLQLLVVAPPEIAAPIREALEPMGIASESRFVATIEEGLDDLRKRLWDAIVITIPNETSDVSGPVRTFVDLAHGAPIVAVTGGIGEDAAAELVRYGASDVVSLARITRLPKVLDRELHTKSPIVAYQQTSRTAYSWFASIVNHLPVGIAYHNERGEIVLCNETALQLLGLTQEEFLGLTALDQRWNIVREDGTPFPKEELPANEAAQTKKSVRDVVMGVYRPKTKDRVWLRVDAIPVVDAEKRLAHVVVKFSDVTEQRRMSEALQTSEERFRSAFEHAGTGMVISTLDFKIVQANGTACRIFGRTPEEIVGMRMQDLTHPEDVPTTLQKSELANGPPLRSVHFEKRYVQPSGKIVFCQVTGETVPDAAGKPLYYVVGIQDMTARKEAEAERNRLQSQLWQAQKMEALGILAGGVAHDFNNILAAILCSADVLLHDLRRFPNAGEMPEIVFELQSAAQRGADLVRQILTFSRRASQRRTPIKLAWAIEDAVLLLRKSCPPKVDLQVHLHSQPFVLADATQLQQILTNLCMNAFHAVDEKAGRIAIDVDTVRVDAAFARTVAGLQERSYAYLCITDNGSGMDAFTLEHIFEPFFTTKSAGKGTGLGMAVVHGIVVAHEGAIRVQSTLGAGTQVEVWLPISESEPNEESAPAPITPTSQSEHILLVDDEEGLARLFGRLLQSLGYRVTVQTQSTKAVALFESDPAVFDAALVDLRMPPPGGIEVAKRLHAIRPDLPIFIMSGFSDALGDTPPIELGLAGILQKPILRETLAKELRAALERRPQK